MSIREAAEQLRKCGGGSVDVIISSHEAMRSAYFRAAAATHPDHYPQHEADHKAVQLAKQVLDKHFGK